MKVRFEIKTSDNQTLLTENEFLKKIDKSIKQAESGKTKKLTKDQQKTISRFMSYSLELTDEALILSIFSAGQTHLKRILSGFLELEIWN